MDNDCSARTPDQDLDGDGDNAIDAPNRPGTDCDDRDPEVAPGKAEVCGDSKDNDCDGNVDEIDCADREPPSVTITSPSTDALLIGGIQIGISFSDDVGVTTLSVRVKDGDTITARTLSPPNALDMVTIEVDSRTLPEGGIVIEATVTDVKGQTATDEVSVRVDNRSGPTINPHPTHQRRDLWRSARHRSPAGGSERSRRRHVPSGRRRDRDRQPRGRVL